MCDCKYEWAHKPVDEMTASDWEKFVKLHNGLPPKPDFQSFNRRFSLVCQLSDMIREHFDEPVDRWQNRSNGKEKYLHYLKSHEWSLKVALVRERSCGTCERCGWAAHEHTHHLTYDRLFNENLKDLLGVCSECHAVLHEKSEDDPRKVEGWRHDEKARFLKTVATDPSFRTRLMRLLRPTRTPSTPSSN